jgi:predicted transcriptional regulator
MLSSSMQPRKAKITLTDYSYRRDIENRMLIAQLSVFEVNVLQEIIHHSLNISIEQLAKDLGTEVDRLTPILDRLESIKLFKRKGLTLSVDKEMRKYFEFQIEKFDDNFKPDLDFLQNVLNRVPIHVLPLWYAIPRSSDNIFASIIEKYFLTPKIYLQYLNELQFDNPILATIVKDVYHAPDFKVTSAELIAKYGLTRELFEEYLLLLEYHFACCLSYNKINDYWEEVVTPFSELREYLQFEAQTKPHPIQGNVERTYYTEFNFIHDLIAVLQACQTKKIDLKDVKNLHAQSSSQLQTLLSKLFQVGFTTQYANDQIMATEKGKIWLSKPLFEQISHLASDPLNMLSNVAEFSELWNFRNVHLIEKTLRGLKPNEWIEFQSFLDGFIAPLGDKETIILKNKGKKWKYALPSYTDHEKQFIQSVIMERLAELGVVATGYIQGKPCFCLTSFGNRFIHF